MGQYQGTAALSGERERRWGILQGHGCFRWMSWPELC